MQKTLPKLCPPVLAHQEVSQAPQAQLQVSLVRGLLQSALPQKVRPVLPSALQRAVSSSPRHQHQRWQVAGLHWSRLPLPLLLSVALHLLLLSRPLADPSLHSSRIKLIFLQTDLSIRQTLLHSR